MSIGQVLFLIVGIWIGIILTSIIMSIRRKMKITRYEQNRPKYDDYGTSLFAWEKACQKSLNWAHERREEKKKEAK